MKINEEELDINYRAWLYPNDSVSFFTRTVKVGFKERHRLS